MATRPWNYSGNDGSEEDGGAEEIGGENGGGEDGGAKDNHNKYNPQNQQQKLHNFGIILYWSLYPHTSTGLEISLKQGFFYS